MPNALSNLATGMSDQDYINAIMRARQQSRLQSTPEAFRTAQEPGLESPMFSPDDLIGSGAITKGALLAKVLASKVGGSNALMGLAGTFIGKNANTWDALAAQKAAQMEAAGHAPEDIWKVTGTFKGADNMWRQEIPDNLAKLRLMPRANQMLQAQTVDDFISHPELLAAHPDLAQTDIRLSRSASGSKGAYLPELNTIELAGLSDTAPYSMSNDVKSTALHELQHAIQQREGFARGGSTYDETLPTNINLGEEVNRKFKGMADSIKSSPEYQAKISQWLIENPTRIGRSGNAIQNTPDHASIYMQHDPLDALELQRKSELDKVLNDGGANFLTGGRAEAYKRLAGEAEARLTQSRMNMTPEERAASYPPSMFDVPMDQQIVRLGNGNALSSMANTRH